MQLVKQNATMIADLIITKHNCVQSSYKYTYTIHIGLPGIKCYTNYAYM